MRAARWLWRGRAALAEIRGPGVPVHMWMYREGDGTAFLDGAPLPSARPVVSFGEHVLAFELASADPRYTVLMFAARHPPPPSEPASRRATGGC